MNQPHPQSIELNNQVNKLIDLFRQNSRICDQLDTRNLETSLKKATAPKFEIVFAGAFSADKSMLINALLERELLYSAEGHATGTECCIQYADAEQERVVLTFLSEREIVTQVGVLCDRLNLNQVEQINDEVVVSLHKTCEEIITQEGGESKSEKAKQAKALSLLIAGWQQNRDRIQPDVHATYSMAEFNFSNLAEAAGYARRGSNSAVLKRVEYYCHHPLLEDGNVLIDTPGIDAPVKKDAELTYSKIEHPDT